MSIVNIRDSYIRLLKMKIIYIITDLFYLSQLRLFLNSNLNVFFFILRHFTVVISFDCTCSNCVCMYICIVYCVCVL